MQYPLFIFLGLFMSYHLFLIIISKKIDESVSSSRVKISCFRATTTWYFVGVYIYKVSYQLSLIMISKKIDESVSFFFLLYCYVLVEIMRRFCDLIK